MDSHVKSASLWGGHAVARMTDDLNAWCRDVSADFVPKCCAARTRAENNYPTRFAKTRLDGYTDLVGGGGGRGARSRHGQVGTQRLWG